MVPLKKPVSHKWVPWRSAEQDWQPWGQRFSLYWANPGQKEGNPRAPDYCTHGDWAVYQGQQDFGCENEAMLISSLWTLGAVFLLGWWPPGKQAEQTHWFNTGCCPPVGLSSALINPSPIPNVFITADHLPPASFSSFFLTFWVSVCPNMCSPTLPSLEGLMLSEKPRTAFERVLPSLFTVQYWQE